jgi:hypothetical protein
MRRDDDEHICTVFVLIGEEVADAGKLAVSRGRRRCESILVSGPYRDYKLGQAQVPTWAPTSV